jgi:hypothetical protein
MKSGSVRKSDAKFNNNYQMACGITPSTSFNPNPDQVISKKINLFIIH